MRKLSPLAVMILKQLSYYLVHYIIPRCEPRSPERILRFWNSGLSPGLVYRVLHKSVLFLNPGLKRIFTRLATMYQDYTIYNLD